MEELIYEAYKESLQYGQCGMLTGNETIEQLCGMIFKAQGIEYMTKYSFPSLGLIRKMAEKYDLTKYHVYVDKGKIKISGERKVCLMGNTEAIVECDGKSVYHIHLLHGAQALVDAKDYAVVATEKDATSKIFTAEADHAKIL